MRSGASCPKTGEEPPVPLPRDGLNCNVGWGRTPSTWRSRARTPGRSKPSCAVPPPSPYHSPDIPSLPEWIIREQMDGCRRATVIKMAAAGTWTSSGGWDAQPFHAASLHLPTGKAGANNPATTSVRTMDIQIKDSTPAISRAAAVSTSTAAALHTGRPPVCYGGNPDYRQAAHPPALTE